MTAGEQPSASAGLLRGVSAFMRAKARTELPAPLRRLQNLRPKDLGRHSPVLMAALEDDVLRARIVEWLDDDPAGIRKEDAAALRAAARGELRNSAAPAAPRRRAPSVSPETAGRQASDARLARERERTAKARAAEAKARRDLEAARAEAARLQKRIEDLHRDLDGARREATEATTRLGTERARAERELRKARKAGQEADEERKRLRKELVDARRETARLRREKDTESRPRPPRKRPARVERPVPERRAPLPVPKGRLEDAPETLAAWLDVPDVTLVVDGYNVTKSETGFVDLSLEAQRERLVDGLGGLARRTSVPAIVVFDGAGGPAVGGPRRRGPVRVEYSRPNESADDHIVARLADLPNHPVVVVTADRELQDRARRRGATIATSDQLLALIR